MGPAEKWRNARRAMGTTKGKWGGNRLYGDKRTENREKGRPLGTEWPRLVLALRKK